MLGRDDACSSVLIQGSLLDVKERGAPLPIEGEEA